MSIALEIIWICAAVFLVALANLRFAMFLGSVDHLPKHQPPPATPTNQSEIPNPQSENE